jgi:hypothetical protein
MRRFFILVLKESKLVGKLLPFLPELQIIAKNVREKYDIKEINPGDEGITEILLAGNEIDCEVVRKDIGSQIRSNPELLPPEYAPLLAIKDQVNLPDEPQIHEPISDDFRAKVTGLYKFYAATIKSQIPLYTGVIDQYYETLTNSVIEYLITGKGREVPADWFGKVGTLPGLQEPVVYAIANRLSDPKLITAQFEAEIIKTFRKKRSRITEETLNSAEYLAMQLSGLTLRDLVDVDMKRHPEIYSFDKKSHRYRPSIRTRKETIRKGIQRLKGLIILMSGDEK